MSIETIAFNIGFATFVEGNIYRRIMVIILLPLGKGGSSTILDGTVIVILALTAISLALSLNKNHRKGSMS